MKNKNIIIAIVVGAIVVAAGIIMTSECDAACQIEKNNKDMKVESFGSLAPEFFNERIAGGVLLDIRTPEEYAEGHLADATLINFYDKDFEDQLKLLDKKVNYSIYCRSGNRSSTALKTMEKLGFKNVYELQGGIGAWANVGLPIVK